MPVAIASSTIVQQAFRLMGIGTLSSLGDTDARVVAAKEQYQSALDMTLEAIDWSFASKVVLKAEAAADENRPEDPRFPYVFVLPEDCLVLREVIDDLARYRVDDQFLRASINGPLQLRYTKQVTDEAGLPATFQLAVSAQLALLMAPEYVKTERAIKRIENAMTTAVDRAARTDGMTASPQSYQRDDISGDWLSEATR